MCQVSQADGGMCKYCYDTKKVIMPLHSQQKFLEEILFDVGIKEWFWKAREEVIIAYGNAPPPPPQEPQEPSTVRAPEAAS